MFSLCLHDHSQPLPMLCNQRAGQWGLGLPGRVLFTPWELTDGVVSRGRWASWGRDTGARGPDAEACVVTYPLGKLKAGREHSEEKCHTLGVTGCAQRDSSVGAQTRGMHVGPKAHEAGGGRRGPAMWFRPLGTIVIQKLIGRLPQFFLGEGPSVLAALEVRGYHQKSLQAVISARP